MKSMPYHLNNILKRLMQCSFKAPVNCFCRGKDSCRGHGFYMDRILSLRAFLIMAFYMDSYGNFMFQLPFYLVIAFISNPVDSFQFHLVKLFYSYNLYLLR